VLDFLSELISERTKAAEAEAARIQTGDFKVKELKSYEMAVKELNQLFQRRINAQKPADDVTLTVTFGDRMRRNPPKDYSWVWEFSATMSPPDLWSEIVLNLPEGEFQTHYVAFEPPGAVRYAQEVWGRFNCICSLQLKDEWRFVGYDGTVIKKGEIFTWTVVPDSGKLNERSRTFKVKRTSAIKKG
jgi:hypothetical protein